MGLPPPAALAEPVTCYPAWHRTYAKYGGSSLFKATKCPVNKTTGNVPCRPEELAAAASKALGVPVSLEAYTLARYIATEVGYGTAEEKVAVAQAAINRARLEGITVVDLLVNRQKAGHPNRGWYGPIHGYNADGSVAIKTAPWGRWAATSFDPSYNDVILILAVLNGVMDGFNKGADDQDGIEYFDDPIASVRRYASRRSYWVGPLPGVNHWRTFLYRKLPDVAPDSEYGRWLVARAEAAVRGTKKTNPGPSWAMLPVCGEPFVRRLVTPGIAFVGAGLVGLLVTGLLAKRGVLGDALRGREDRWYRHRRRVPERLCYRSKTDALQAFRDANLDTIDAWGGLDAEARPADFDAINHKHGLKGRKAVRTLAKAMWYAMPARPPFCLDQIDLDALNDTAPGQKGRGFTLPNWVYEGAATAKAEEDYYLAKREREAEEASRQIIDRAFDRALAKRGHDLPDVPF